MEHTGKIKKGKLVFLKQEEVVFIMETQNLLSSHFHISIYLFLSHMIVPKVLIN